MVTNDVVVVPRRHGNVEILTLSRPSAMNAINAPMLAQLSEHARRIRKDDSVGCVILTGGAREDGRPCFSAGDDLREAAAGGTPPGNPGKKLCDLIDGMLVPWIAMIDGVCTTGAVELALACDLRYVADTARISDWHLSRLGSGLGGWGASTRWAKLVGVANATEIILTGKEIDGAEALRIGFAQRVITSSALQEETLATAEVIAGMERNGVRHTLAHLKRAQDLSKEEALAFADQVRTWMPSDRSFASSASKVLDKSETADGHTTGGNA